MKDAGNREEDPQCYIKNKVRFNYTLFFAYLFFSFFHASRECGKTFLIWMPQSNRDFSDADCPSGALQ
jgi:hypothetical protein